MVIELRGIGREGSTLQNFSLQIDHGSLTGLGGIAGGNAVRLARILALEDEQWTGEFFLRGVAVRELDPWQRRDLRRRALGVVLADERLVPELTVFENLEVPLTSTTPRRERDALISPLLAELEMEEYRDCYPRSLSRRESHLVKIARALVSSPTAVIADDLSSCLRPADWGRVCDLLRAASARGAAVVVVSRAEQRALERPFGAVGAAMRERSRERLAAAS